MVEQEKKNQPVLTSLVNVGMKKWNPSVHHPSGLLYWWVLVHSGHMVHVQNRALHWGRVFWGHVHNSVPWNRGTMYNPTPWSWSLRNSLFKSCSLLILLLVVSWTCNKWSCQKRSPVGRLLQTALLFGLAYLGKDIVFRFIIEYSSLRNFGPCVVGLFLYEDFWKMMFLACVETWD
jgi:hypothetical protein